MSDHTTLLKTEFEDHSTDQSSANYFCFVGTQFGRWLLDMHTSQDEWIHACSFSLHLANDFFSFVRSYRTGDLIGVEIGYQLFAPVFRMQGTHQ